MLNIGQKSGFHNGHNFGLDWLRTVLVLLGIPYHVCSFLNKDFYEFSALKFFTFDPTLFLFWISHLFRMQVFMVIAGFVFVPMLQRYSLSDLLIKRTRKILVPLVLCYLLLNPVLTASVIYSWNIDHSSFLQIFQKVLQTMLQGKVWILFLWFLLYLYSFTVLATVLYQVAIMLNISLRLNINTPFEKFSFYALIVIILLLANFGTSQWTDIGRPFQFQPADPKMQSWFYYFTFFLIGMVFSQFPQVYADLKENFKKFALIALICTVIILSFFFVVQWQRTGNFATDLVLRFLVALLSLSLTVGFFGFAVSRFGDVSWWVRIVAKHSYPLYITHYIYCHIFCLWLLYSKFSPAGVFLLATPLVLLSCGFQIALVEKLKVKSKHKHK